MQIGRLASLSVVALVSLFSVDASFAQPGAVVRCEINQAMNDGGRIAGYVVMDSVGGCRPQTFVLDYRIYVTGGNEQALPAMVWDRSNSTPFFSHFTDPGAFFYLETADAGCPGAPRRLSLLHGVGESNCLASRGQVADAGAAPLLMLRMNGSAANVVETGPMVTATFDMYPTGLVTPLTWYWIVRVDGELRWVGPAGVTSTPQVLATTAPYETGTLTLFKQDMPPGTVIDIWFFGAAGNSIVALDAIRAVVASQQ